MKIKAGANIQNIDVRMRPVLIAAERIWKEHGQELVVTCGLDGTHSAGSLHYYGRALDFRTHYFDIYVSQEIVNELRAALGSDYDVVLESDHIHVEFDPPNEGGFKDDSYSRT